MLVLRTFFLTIAILTFAASASAQVFRTERLRRAAEVTGITSQVAVLGSDTTVWLKASDGRVVSVRTAHDGSIAHVGVPLFSNVLRMLQPSPVYDFLEYAVLNKACRVEPNQLYLSKVLFRKGSWQSLAADSLYSYECTIANQDDRLYVVSWQHNGREIATVGVPIDYELLANETRRNMERDFVRQLLGYQPPTVQSVFEPVTIDALAVYGTNGLFVLQGKSFMLPELNQNVYYHLVDNDSIPGKVIPSVVVDAERPAETFANVMMDATGNAPEVIMHLDFHFSDYRRQQAVMPLARLRAFLCQQGCELYFACSRTDSQELRGVLFARNAASGYNHLLSLCLPTGQLTATHPEVKADAYLFIPAIDKSNLFGTVPEGKSGAFKSH